MLKKVIKRVLSIALLAAVFFGGYKFFKGSDSATRRELAENVIDSAQNMGYAVADGIENADYDINEGDIFDETHETTDEDIDFEIDMEDVHSISMSFAGINVRYAHADTGGKILIRVVKPTRAQLYVEDGKDVYLNVAGGELTLDALSNAGVYVTVPVESGYVPELSISFGMGSFQADMIECQSFYFKNNAGNATIGKVAANAEDESDMSSIRLENGAGYLRIDSMVSDLAELKCTAGAITVSPEGGVETYDYEIVSAVGSVNIGGRLYRELATRAYIDNQALSSMTIDCSVGSVEVR